MPVALTVEFLVALARRPRSLSSVSSRGAHAETAGVVNATGCAERERWFVCADDKQKRKCCIHWRLRQRLGPRAWGLSTGA